MKKFLIQSGARHGFSLAEVIAALIIGAMILVSMLTIYNRIQRSADAVENKFTSSALQNEVFQRIAEDVDRIISNDADTKVTIQNKTTNGYPSAMITLLKSYKDTQNRDNNFERIIWTCGYDYESQAGRLALYRSYSGIGMEDKVLDIKKEDWERDVYVPICSGITYMKIKAVQDKEPVEKWDGAPPPGIIVEISFAEPFKKIDGTLDVPQEQKFSRTIAIDRTRKIKFSIEQARPDSAGQTPAATGSPAVNPTKTGASATNKEKVNVK